MRCVLQVAPVLLVLVVAVCALDGLVSERGFWIVFLVACALTWGGCCCNLCESVVRRPNSVLAGVSAGLWCCAAPVVGLPLALKRLGAWTSPYLIVLIPFFAVAGCCLLCLLGLQAAGRRSSLSRYGARVLCFAATMFAAEAALASVQLCFESPPLNFLWLLLPALPLLQLTCEVPLIVRDLL